MATIQEKIQLLIKIAHKLNESNVEWVLGASMMLYFKGIVTEFHDIDLLIAEKNIEIVNSILVEIGKRLPPSQTPNPMYKTKAFMEFVIDSIDIDVMAGFGIIKDGKFYDCSLRKDQIVEKITLGNETIPLQSPSLWIKYYRLMGRNKKAEMIEKAIQVQQN